MANQKILGLIKRQLWLSTPYTGLNPLFIDSCIVKEYKFKNSFCPFLFQEEKPSLTSVLYV